MTEYVIQMNTTPSGKPQYLKEREDLYGRLTMELSEARGYKTLAGAQRQAKRWSCPYYTPVVLEVYTVRGEFGWWQETRRAA